MSDSCGWTTESTVAAVIAVVGWGWALFQWKVSRRDRSIELLGTSLNDVQQLHADLTSTIHKLTETCLKPGDFTSADSINLQIASVAGFHALFNKLELICTQIDSGAVHWEFAKDDLQPLLEPFARAQIDWYVVLKVTAEKAGRVFDTAQAPKTYQKFYRVIRTRLPMKIRLELVEARKTAGLPSAHNELIEKQTSNPQ